MKDIKLITEKINRKRRKNPIGLLVVLIVFVCAIVFLYQFIFSNRTFTENDVKEKNFPAQAFGRTIESSANKIVSLSPTVTEAILSLPIQDVLIGVSEYCNTRGKTIKKLGTPLMPKTDDIIALQPEYLVIQTPLNEMDKTKIEQAGIKILIANSLKSMEDLKELYRSLSALIWGTDIASTISENIIFDMESKLKLYEYALRTTEKKTVLLLFNEYGMVATEDTLEAEILKNFFILANKGNDYYSNLPDLLAETDPQVIITSDEITLEDLIAMGFSHTQAFTQQHIYTLPIKDFENISPRIVKYLSEIANIVYMENISPVSLQTISAGNDLPT